MSSLKFPVSVLLIALAVVITFAPGRVQLSAQIRTGVTTPAINKLPTADLFVQVNAHGQKLPQLPRGCAHMYMATADWFFNHDGVEFYPLGSHRAGQPHERGMTFSFDRWESYFDFYFRPGGKASMVMDIETPIQTPETYDRVIGRFRELSPGTPVGAYVHTGMPGIVWQKIMRGGAHRGSCDFAYMHLGDAKEIDDLNEWCRLLEGVRIGRAGVVGFQPHTLGEAAEMYEHIKWVRANYPHFKIMVYLHRPLGAEEEYIIRVALAAVRGEPMPPPYSPPQSE